MVKEEQAYKEAVKRQQIDSNLSEFTDQQKELFANRCPAGYRKCFIISKSAYCVVYEGYHVEGDELVCLK